MKRILKNEEPIAFANWKNQEAGQLEPYYVANNADAAWGHLSSSPSPNPEPGIGYYSKKNWQCTAQRAGLFMLLPQSAKSIRNCHAK
ncbi:MAG: hypothetical protein IPN76_06710 [Saprospiraceae bacterium]|nr:hypothetical protein [Saprospiraceae bacterium]